MNNMMLAGQQNQGADASVKQQTNHQYGIRPYPPVQPYVHICNHSSVTGDSFVHNCRLCGAFLPKTGSNALRGNDKKYNCNFFVSDMLRAAYTQCQKTHGLKVHPKYAEIRSMIIDWLCEVTEALKFKQRTLFYAIAVHDKFMHRKGSQDFQQGFSEIDKLLINALACLFISCKQNEIDPQIPVSSKFMRFLPTKFQNQHNQFYPADVDRYGKSQRLVNAELDVLVNIDMDCDGHISFFTVLEIFTAQGILFSNDQVVNPENRQTKQIDIRALPLIEKYLEFFALLCLQDLQFFNDNPYTISCSIISAARLHCNIVPVWPPELVQLTGLQHHHFLSLEQKIVSSFQKSFDQSSETDSAQASTNLHSKKSVGSPNTTTDSRTTSMMSPLMSAQPQRNTYDISPEMQEAAQKHIKHSAQTIAHRDSISSTNTVIQPYDNTKQSHHAHQNSIQSQKHQQTFMQHNQPPSQQQMQTLPPKISPEKKQNQSNQVNPFPMAKHISNSSSKASMASISSQPDEMAHPVTDKQYSRRQQNHHNFQVTRQITTLKNKRTPTPVKRNESGTRADNRPSMWANLKNDRRANPHAHKLQQHAENSSLNKQQIRPPKASGASTRKPQHNFDHPRSSTEMGANGSQGGSFLKQAATDRHTNINSQRSNNMRMHQAQAPRPPATGMNQTKNNTRHSTRSSMHQQDGPQQQQYSSRSAVKGSATRDPVVKSNPNVNQHQFRSQQQYIQEGGQMRNTGQPQDAPKYQAPLQRNRSATSRTSQQNQDPPNRLSGNFVSQQQQSTRNASNSSRKGYQQTTTFSSVLQQQNNSKAAPLRRVSSASGRKQSQERGNSQSSLNRFRF